MNILVPIEEQINVRWKPGKPKKEAPPSLAPAAATQIIGPTTISGNREIHRDRTPSRPGSNRTGPRLTPEAVIEKKRLKSTLG